MTMVSFDRLDIPSVRLTLGLDGNRPAESNDGGALRVGKIRGRLRRNPYSRAPSLVLDNGRREGIIRGLMCGLTEAGGRPGGKAGNDGS